MQANERDKELDKLALKAKQGDREALAKLLVHSGIKKLIYTIANDRVGSANADDMYQEVRLSISQKMDTWLGRAKITTWISRVTHNTCTDFLRKEKPSWIVITENIPEQRAEPEQIRKILLQEIRGLAENALRQIGEECAQLLRPFIEEGIGKNEILKRSQLPRTTFYRKWNDCYYALLRNFRKITHSSREK